ncbi:MAG: hypothetical protein HF312_13370 [Ignavibacteria bacterium]|jgi:hypothetical protein|nr:hypothetical protein [Ignavibacteria bacterium]MCU7521204.1 hypothetical protein [Ignavibacteria bacterium]
MSTQIAILFDLLISIKLELDMTQVFCYFKHKPTRIVMKINFWKPALATGIIKLTVHRDGNMGFSSGAVKKLNIDEKSYVKIGTNGSDTRDSNLYLMHTNDFDENALKVNKAGDYYYLNTKSFFNELNIDYTKKKLVYDIVEMDYDGNTIYKLIRRELERKKK